MVHRVSLTRKRLRDCGDEVEQFNIPSSNKKQPTSGTKQKIETNTWAHNPPYLPQYHSSDLLHIPREHCSWPMEASFRSSLDRLINTVAQTMSVSDRQKSPYPRNIICRYDVSMTIKRVLPKYSRRCWGWLWLDVRENKEELNMRSTNDVWSISSCLWAISTTTSSVHQV